MNEGRNLARENMELGKRRKNHGVKLEGLAELPELTQPTKFLQLGEKKKIIK